MRAVSASLAVFCALLVAACVPQAEESKPNAAADEAAIRTIMATREAQRNINPYPRETRTTQEIVVSQSGDMAYAFGSFIEAYDNAIASPRNGHFVEVFNKNSKGEWQRVDGAIERLPPPPPTFR